MFKSMFKYSWQQIQSKSYIKIHVIKHDMDSYSNINYSRKNPQMLLLRTVIFFKKAAESSQIFSKIALLGKHGQDF